jgi:SAM-dependent methyltransferase
MPDSAADKIIGIYERHAGVWSRDRGDYLYEKGWIDSFLALLPKDPTVLDIGCGTGVPIARYLMEHRCQVTGVDASSAMITRCVDRFPERTWHLADMRTLALNQRFDGILAWDSFFHLTQDDQRRMFPIFGRHAAAGAALIFTGGPSAGEAIGSFEGEPLFHASLDTDEYRRLLHANGFDVVSHVVGDPTCGDHTIWLARAKSAG